MIVDVIIPTLGKQHALDAVCSLKYLPFPIRLHVVKEGKSWPEAVNIGIAESKGDVLLMDDDVEILSNTFDDFQSYYDRADIFGFKLLFPDGKIQHAGGLIRRDCIGHIGYGETDSPRHSAVLEVCHVTASLIYIKRPVIDRIGGMETSWRGAQFEDVDFSMKALKQGFKIFYIPNPAIHGESQSKNQPGFLEKLNANREALIDRYWGDENLMNYLDGFPIEIQ